MTLQLRSRQVFRDDSSVFPRETQLNFVRLHLENMSIADFALSRVGSLEWN